MAVLAVLAALVEAHALLCVTWAAGLPPAWAEGVVRAWAGLLPAWVAAFATAVLADSARRRRMARRRQWAGSAAPVSTVRRRQWAGSAAPVSTVRRPS